MESTELMDSYPWKWWKNIAAQPDFANVKIELVDILHFSLSGTMQLQSCERSVVPAIAGKKVSEVFTPFTPSPAPTTLKTAVEGTIFFPLSDTPNAIASFRNVIQLANAYRFDLITESVISAAEDLDFNLVAYYVAKHTLNCIRQLGGYKSGTYVKVNKGVEDNVLLHDCIKGITVEEVLDEKTYLTMWNTIVMRVYEAFQVPEADRKDVNHWIAVSEGSK
ncbi:dUTP pyrophosphatase [Angomonas deanei]|nr:dUTP pyrophosphatase [Angomonas deanei]|eukprot:EPY43548.1 dUTP pyrophosphatase [Angomonas deanei]